MGIVLSILKFFPYVLAATVAVEQQIVAPGATKKAIILNAITGAARAGEQVPVADVATVSALIDATVQTLNATGVFNHGQPQSAAPAAAPKA